MTKGDSVNQNQSSNSGNTSLAMMILFIIFVIIIAFVIFVIIVVIYAIIAHDTKNPILNYLGLEKIVSTGSQSSKTSLIPDINNNSMIENNFKN